MTRVTFRFVDQVRDSLCRFGATSAGGDDGGLRETPSFSERRHVGPAHELDDALEVILFFVPVILRDGFDLVDLNEGERGAALVLVLYLRRGTSRAVPEAKAHGLLNHRQ